MHSDASQQEEWKEQALCSTLQLIEVLDPFKWDEKLRCKYQQEWNFKLFFWWISTWQF